MAFNLLRLEKLQAGRISLVLRPFLALLAVCLPLFADATNLIFYDQNFRCNYSGRAIAKPLSMRVQRQSAFAQENFFIIVQYEIKSPNDDTVVFRSAGLRRPGLSKGEFSAFAGYKIEDAFVLKRQMESARSIVVHRPCNEPPTILMIVPNH